MALPPITIIWVDASFDEFDKYQPMKDEFEKHTGTQQPDPIDFVICNEMKLDLDSNGAPFITVKSPVEAMQQIAKHHDKKIFFIASGSLGRNIIPDIVLQYPQVHSFYIYCFKMADHVEWAINYLTCLKMFDHQIDLLVRLTRDIAGYFIEQGRIHLQLGFPNEALTCFKHAQTLEIQANKRDKMESNKNEKTPHAQRDIRERLDLLEGEDGLIRQAERALDQ